MSVTETFLIALLIIFAVPYGLWRVLGGRNALPLVVVQIIGGIVLGPGALGAVFPDYYATIFRPEVISALNGIAWWGVMLFVWLAGLELDLSEAWRQRRETGITSGLALVVPLVLGSLAALVLVQRPGWVGPGGAAWQTVLGLGMSCAVTALPILLMFLSNLDLMRHPLGQRILRYASLDDIAIWVVLALILMDVQQLSLQLGFALFFALLAEPMRRLIPRLRETDRWAVGLIWMVGCGLFADRAGLHYMVGAFLAGAVLDGKWFGHDRMAAFRDMLLLALMPIFFLSTGLRTAWDMGGAAVAGGFGRREAAWRASGRADFGLAQGRGGGDWLDAADQGADHDHLCQYLAGQGDHHQRQLYRAVVDGGWQHLADHADCRTQIAAFGQKLSKRESRSLSD